MDSNEKNMCVICLDQINYLTKVKCGHRFCYECIVRWSQRQANCPLCRQSYNSLSHYKTDRDLIRSMVRVKQQTNTYVLHITVGGTDSQITIGPNVEFKYYLGSLGEAFIKTGPNKIVAIRPIVREIDSTQIGYTTYYFDKRSLYLLFDCRNSYFALADDLDSTLDFLNSKIQNSDSNLTLDFDNDSDNDSDSDASINTIDN